MRQWHSILSTLQSTEAVMMVWNKCIASYSYLEHLKVFCLNHYWTGSQYQLMLD